MTVYFPEIAAVLRDTGGSRFVVDGELVIPVRQSLSFEALLARLHPAESRRRKLAAETPARFMLFDVLADNEALLQTPLAERRKCLEKFFRALAGDEKILLSPQTATPAKREAG